jgi:hypothetical protein
MLVFIMSFVILISDDTIYVNPFGNNIGTEYA